VEVLEQDYVERMTDLEAVIPGASATDLDVARNGVKLIRTRT
jgi:hypothetical protein